MEAEEETEVDLMVVAVVMAIVDKEDVVEVAMVKIHTNFPAGTENSLQKLVYTLQTNGYFSTNKKRIILKK